VSIDEPLAVLGVELILNFLPSIAEVEHKLGGTGDDLIAAFSDHGHLLNGRDPRKLLGKLMLFFKCLKVAVFILDLTNVQYR